MMNIIGLSALAHDPSAIFIQNRIIKFALEEEKITRIKNEWIFPNAAVKKLLENYKNEEIDTVAFYWDDSGNTLNAITAELKNIFDKNIPTLRRIIKRINACRNDRVIKDKIHQQISPQVSVEFHSHHLCHARYAIEMANYEDAAVIVVDGRGEYETTSIFRLKAGELAKIESIAMPHSLGYVYGAITQFLGFKPNSDEYRIMGLAAYGKENKTLRSFFARLIVLDNLYRIDMSLVNYQYEESSEKPWLSHKAIKILGGARKEVEAITQHHMDIAYALQQRFEEVMLHLCHVAKEGCVSNNLIITGGCAMNSVMNGKILTAKIFQNVFVPIAGDQSCAIGAALLSQDKHYGSGVSISQIQENTSAFLGCQYSDSQIEALLLELQLPYIRLDNPANHIAMLLSENNIVAVFYGKLEFGARALGHRSILANPAYADNREKINSMIKFREPFRPFAGSIIKSKLADVTGTDANMPYMNFVLQVKDNWRNKISAVVHIDGSCRFQTVSENDCPFYHQVIQEFNALTGLPVILNTSFNIKGEPIVRSPLDAIRCFYSTGLEYLVLNRFLLTKCKVDND
ncbi:TPA: carbamoyltransferase [Salmonella enterica subsp. enterica serovar Bahrenfeld]